MINTFMLKLDINLKIDNKILNKIERVLNEHFDI